MNLKRSASATFLLIAFSLVCFAQSPSIDPGFVPALSHGSPDLIFTQAIQPDGKILYIGNFQVANGQVGGGVTRFNSGGSVDTSFSCAVCTTFKVTNAIVQPDGKILVGGYRSVAQSFDVMVRLNSDGSQDNSFQYTSNTVTAQYDLWVKGILPNGKIMIVVRKQPNPSTDTVFRLNPDGSKDLTFNPIVQTFGANNVTDVRVFPDGRVFMFGNNQYGYLALLNDDGSKNMSFTSPVLTSPGLTVPVVNDVALQADGKIVFSGFFNSVNGTSKVNAARLNADQSVDSTFGQQLTNGTILQIIPVSNGKFIIKGNANVLPQIIQRLNGDGSVDPAFTPPANASFNNPIYVDQAERIYIYAYRFNANGTTDTSYFANIEVPGSVGAMCRQNDGKILVGGQFDRTNGTLGKYVSRLNADGTTDTSFNTGSSFNFVVIDISVQSDNKVLVAGNFWYNSAPKSVVRLNADGTLDGTFSATTGSSPSFGGGIYDVKALADGKILISGEFTAVNGQARAGFARLNSDGSLDTSVDLQLPSGSKVNRVIVQPDGKIMLAGSFSSVNGVSRANLARLSSNLTLDTSFNATVSAASSVYVQSDGKYLGASGGQIYRLNSNGSPDNSFTSPVLTGTLPTIFDIAQLNDGSYVVGGIFLTVNGISRNYIVKLSSAGAVDPAAFLTGADNTVIRLVKLPDGNLIAAGGFSLIEGKPRTGIAKLVFNPASKAFDFDGDGRADISVTRPGAAYTWYQLGGVNHTFTQINFGQTGDIVAPADFDGDGKTDIAIFRPSNGQWWYLSSVDGTQRSVTSGASGDIPLPSDFTGDGKADFVLYRPSTGQWWRMENGGATTSNILFGATGDKPLIGDFDGDGKSDPAIFRPSTGTFWYAASSQGNAFRAFQWGTSTDIPAVADYDGDGKTDFAIYRPSNSVWWIYNSSNGTTSNATWGTSEDRPIPADYDGDGKADIAVYRPSNGTWYLLTSTSGFAGFQWGISTDIPSPGAFVP